MDDDLFLCTKELYNYLLELKIKSNLQKDKFENLYFGYVHNLEESSYPNRRTRIDEMFVLLGNNLAKNLVTDRKYCYGNSDSIDKSGRSCNSSEYLIDLDLAGRSLGKWLTFYENDTTKRAVMHPANKIFAHTSSPQYLKLSLSENFLNYRHEKVVESENGFCDSYLLWHKASINDQKFLYNQYIKNRKEKGHLIVKKDVIKNN